MENNEYSDYRKETESVRQIPIVNEQPKPERRRMNFWSCCSVVCVAIVAMLTLTTCEFISLIGEGIESAMKNAESENEDDILKNAKHLQGPADAAKMTAVINVKGVILSDTHSSFDNANSAKICKLIRIADRDHRVAAIVLYLDTPGGEVTASDEIWHAVRTAKKPVVAYMGSMATSGGYYIASGADKIVSHRTTLTGSIGVIIETWNYHVLINRLGIESQVYTSGKMKAMLHGGKKTTAEEKNIVQELVMSSYREFLKVVADGRKIPYEKLVNSPLTDGRILDGKQALAAGLVDKNGYFADAVQEAEKLAKVAPGSTKVVLMKPQTNFMDMLMEFRSSVGKPSVKVDLPGSNNFQLTPGKAYYLPVNQ